MTTIEKIQSEYPLHWAVWNDDHKELQDLIKTKKVSTTRKHKGFSNSLHLKQQLVTLPYVHEWLKMCGQIVSKTII